MEKIARSAIKSVDIAAKPEKVFGFLANPLNWPQYAVVNLRSVAPAENGGFKVITRFGEGELRMYAVEEFGILDHTWTDPQASVLV